MTERWRRWTGWVETGWVALSGYVGLWLDAKPRGDPTGETRLGWDMGEGHYWAPVTQEEEAAARLGGFEAAWAIAEERLRRLEPP